MTTATADLRVSLDDESAVGGVVQAVVQSGAKILTLNKVEPTLEDVIDHYSQTIVDALRVLQHGDDTSALAVANREVLN